jgi:hypothetical protein
MSELKNSQHELYAGLQALVDSAFPKRCNVCGRVYETADDFIRQTRMVRPESTGLKQALNDDDAVMVELYRNCVCGSTLLDLFSCRRDASSAGEQRRMYFNVMLGKLVETGYSMSVARAELIKVMRGEDSEILHDHDPES